MQNARYDDWEDLVPNLQVGDILLIRDNLLVSRAVQGLTRSYWSHVGMVFEITHPDAKNRIVLIIEALDNGIEIHRLRRYMNRLGTRRIGFKRLPGLTDAQREKIRGFFLENIDVPYDYRRLFSFFLSRMFSRSLGKDASERLLQKGITLENYLCSTFVQRAFYLALPPKERKRALFRSGKKLSLMEQLEICTPKDIAKSENAEWLWNPHH